MGILRLILALSVVAAHAPFPNAPFIFMNASAAVVCFFVISGFYMALVLNEKYTDLASFAKARFVRIYPAYWFFLALSLVAFGKTFDPLAVFFSATLIGRDYFFLAHLPQGLEIPLGQAWSIALELQFYSVAAMTFRTRKGIILTFIAAAFLRAAMQMLGYIETPLGTWLSLNSLVFFCAGGLSYLLYDRIRREPVSTRAFYAACIGIVTLLYLRHFHGFQLIDPNGADARFYTLYVCVAALVPFLFSLTKDLRLDRFLGDLSYPVYLSHIFIIDIANRAGYGPLFILAGTFAISAVWMFFLEKQIHLLVIKLFHNDESRSAIAAGKSIGTSRPSSSGSTHTV